MYLNKHSKNRYSYTFLLLSNTYVFLFPQVGFLCISNINATWSNLLTTTSFCIWLQLIFHACLECFFFFKLLFSKSHSDILNHSLHTVNAPKNMSTDKECLWSNENRSSQKKCNQNSQQKYRVSFWEKHTCNFILSA